MLGGGTGSFGNGRRTWTAVYQPVVPQRELCESTWRGDHAFRFVLYVLQSAMEESLILMIMQIFPFIMQWMGIQWRCVD